VQVEHDQVRAVLAREIEPECALHCGDQFDLWVSGKDPLDQREVREVVLDVQDPLPSAALAAERVWRAGGAGRIARLRGGLGGWQVDRDCRSDAWLSGDVDRASHPVEQAFGEC